jgi:hypothetical protein
MRGADQHIRPWRFRIAEQGDPVEERPCEPHDQRGLERVDGLLESRERVAAPADLLAEVGEQEQWEERDHARLERDRSPRECRQTHPSHVDQRQRE